jgi:hypothetical protein
MLRDVFITIISILGIALFSATSFAANDTTMLTDKTVITGDSVTVGDVFTNAGEHASFVLAPAPSSAKPLILNKKDLQRIAAYFNLNWQTPADFSALILKSERTDKNSVMVPVLAVPLAANSIIKAEDITELAVPRDSLRSAMILDKEALIGMAPKRLIMPEQLIMTIDITPPVIVKRNELINVSYKNGPI